ncbi:uncharacterized protein sytl2a isoform X2 [Epinephelus lanceolatus]
MIDLSFLTEEEQETILAVLKRDAELKKAEEQRVQKLQRTVNDKSVLRYMTGEWFYETKQLRHQDRIHGSEIIRASMRHSYKPLTILELSQVLPEKPSFVSSENKEVFVPPVLCGVLQEPHMQLSSQRYQNQNPYETPQDTPQPMLQSPTKQRKNPFDSDTELLYRAVDQTQTQNEDVSEKCHSEFLSPAVPRLVPAEQESGKPVHLETEPAEERHSQAEATDWPAGHNIHHQELPEQRPDISVKATSGSKQSANASSRSSSHAVSPKPRQRLLGIFRREKEKTAEVQNPQKEKAKIPEQKDPGYTSTLSQGAADMTMDRPASVRPEAKPSEMTEVKTLQLTALQNTPFKETVTSVDADTQQEATEGRVVPLPERLSNLKAFWERENSGPKIIFTREEAKRKDMAKTGIEASHGRQTNSDMESINNNLLTQMEMTAEDTAGRSQENISSPQTDCSLSDLSKEDGTYRANPVLIYDETDDSLTDSVTESQISEPQENIISPVPSSGTVNTRKQERDIPVPPPRQSCSSPQEDRAAKISEVKHFWEKEYAGPRVIAARVKEASHSSILSNKVSPQSDVKETSEKLEGEAQTSPYKTKSNFSKSLKVTDKGFVSPERSQLRSSGSAGDIQSTCHQYQVKADTEYQERPLSPSKSPTPRSKDQDDEVRRSPSKTIHPRVLPRESSSPKRSTLEGSPLKTFPIDIDPQTKVVEEQQWKPIPVPRQKKSPSHEAKQKVLIDTKTDIMSRPLPPHPEDRGASLGNSNTQQSSSSSSTSPQSKKASEKKVEPFTQLARSFIPQDYQHYLGPQEKAHVPPFYQERIAAAESDAVRTPQNTLKGFVGNQNDSLTEGSPPGVSPWFVQKKDGNSSQKTTTRAWSLSRASSGSHDDSSSPVMSALKRLSSRRVSSSKSLENLTSKTREERSQNNSKEEMNQSVEDVSSPSANSKQMKASVSVNVLHQDETDSDSTFETNLGWRRNTGSSMSNLSLSSGMASMSSVSGSMSSIYPADFGDIEVQGSIQFAVNYIQKLGEFHIFVVHCRDLAVADTKKNYSDPYVKCYVVPDKTKLGKRKTTVKKKTLNPNYNEILRFKIMIEVLKTQNLNISVWHHNTFGRNSFLGEVDLDLSEWDFSNTNINEYALKSRVSAQSPTASPSHMMDSRGQMRVALRFLPQTSHSNRTSRMETGEVQIWVKDCKSLPPVRGVIIDPFVKCTVLPDTSRKSRQKTRVVKRTANPMFNHTMVYDGFRSEDLREACVEITVWDHDRLNNHFIGGLRLGLGTGKSYGVEVDWMDSATDEANLWQRMLQSDGDWVEDVLPLRMFVMAKSMSK